jgi:hypothetical protein
MSKQESESDSRCVALDQTRSWSSMFAAFIALVVLGDGGFLGQSTTIAAEPTNLEELNRWYVEPPAGQNAATYFMRGFELLQITTADRSSPDLPLIGTATMPIVTNSVSAEMKVAIGDFLERNQPALAFFVQGAQHTNSRYPLDLTKGSEAKLPHLAKVRSAARLLELDALHQAVSNRGSNAANSVLLAVLTGRTLDAEPPLISQLVRIACESGAVEGLQQVLNRTLVPSGSLAGLQTAFERATESEAAGTGLTRALISERVEGLDILEHPDKYRETIQSLEALDDVLPGLDTTNLLAHLQEQRAFLQKCYGEAIEAHKAPFPERLKTSDIFSRSAIESEARGYSFVKMILPALSKVVTREGRTLAELRLAQTAIALERFRAANSGRYPDSLTALSPKLLATVPSDPFDGKPLRYRKAGDGYLLYSIGPDSKDDQGEHKRGSDDVTFSVANPPRS